MRALFWLSVPVLLLVLLGSSAQTSWAHPVVIDSSPKPFESLSTSPSEVSVFFSEPIEMSYSRISVIASDGSRVEEGEPRNVAGDTSSIGISLKPNLPEGVYTVTTRVLSAVDGHVVDNAFTFAIGTVATPGEGQSNTIVSISESASRFPGMVGQIMVVGSAFATLWLWKPIEKLGGLAPLVAKQRQNIDKNMLLLMVAGTGLVVASNVAMVVVQSISVGAPISDIIETKFGNVWLARMMQSLILASLVVTVYFRMVKGRTYGKGENIVILAVGVAILFTSSLIAHAAATNEAIAVGLDFFHNVAASIWIGGLILLAFVAVPKLLEIEDPKARAASISILIPRFSTIVVVILGLAIVTGPTLLFIIEDDLSLTLASTYGKVLIVKLLLAAAMIALGAYSQFVVHRKAIAAMKNGSPVRFSGFSASLKAEAGLGVLLLLMVSVMANGALPSGEFPSYGKQAAAESGDKGPTEFVQTLYGKDSKTRISISPFAVGQNSFAISFDSPMRVESATIKLIQIEKGIGPISVETKESDGLFVADASFSLPGKWSVEIEGVRPESSNIVTAFDVNVKPLLADMKFDVAVYELPVQSLPLYPVFDKERQVIWVGDTLPQSGRIWQFDTESGNYTQHNISNANLITQSALDYQNNLWYIDPVTEILGVYNPESGLNKQFSVPSEGIISGLAVGSDGNVWMTATQSNKVIRFDSSSEEFTSYAIPTASATPSGLAIDSLGNVWFAEAIGKIAKLDPSSGDITESTPNDPLALQTPAAVFPDAESSRIYVAEHEGKAVTAFNPLTGTFKEYPIKSEGGLPFGMAMDGYGNLWFAQHEIDAIAIVDPRTGDVAEARIPLRGSFVQWLTSDDQGRIWFAAQRGGALGSISISSSARPTSATVNEQASAPAVNDVGFSLADVIGPGIAAGVVTSAILYAKNRMDLERSVREASGMTINRKSRT